MIQSKGFTKLPQLPSSFVDHMPKPLMHPLKPDHIIISTDHYCENYGIYEYNLETNQTQLIYKYIDNNEENTFLPQTHAHSVDPQNNLLYLFGGSSSTSSDFSIFNLKTKKMKSYLSEAVRSCGSYLKSCYIASPLNQIHLCNWNQNVGFHVNWKTMEEFQFVDGEHTGFEYPKLLYTPHNKKLMVFGFQRDDEIWECDIETDIKQNKYEWKLHTVRMPYAVLDDFYDILLAFQHLVFVFYFPTSTYSDIWILDLLRNEWFKSKYEIPNIITSANNLFVIKDSKNYCHIIDFPGQYHFKLYLADLIPDSLRIFYMEYYHPLITGYLREQEKMESISNIPSDLASIILNYFVFG